jgi:hypothetical protein
MTRQSQALNIICALILASLLSHESRAEREETTTAPKVSPEEIYQGVPAFLLKADHTDMKAVFAGKVKTLPQWHESLNQDGFDLVCLGETHSESFRQFLTTSFFSGVRFDHLLLEEKENKVPDLVSRVKSGEEASMLGAPIAALLRESFALNPALKVTGIESDQKQTHRATLETIGLGRQKLSREAFIGLNLMNAWKKGERTVALYGSLHCGLLNEGLGLDSPFYRLIQPEIRARKASAHNVKVVRAEDVRVLLALLTRYEFYKTGQGPVVLTGLRSIPPAAYNHHADLFRLFSSFDTVIIRP